MIFKGLCKKTGNEIIGQGIIPPNPDMQDGILVFKQSPMCEETGSIEVYTEIIPIVFDSIEVSFNNGKAWDDIKKIEELMSMGREYETAMMCKPSLQTEV